MTSNRISPASYSIYAPLRYEATRPYSVRIGEQYLRYAGMTLTARNKHLVHDIAPAMRKAMRTAGKPFEGNSILAEVNNFLCFGEFIKGGRVIYDLHRKLTEALAATDVEDLPVSLLPKPADSLYLHFGDADLKNEGCGDIEGAFVSWRSIAGEPETLNIYLATKHAFASPFFWKEENIEIGNGSMIDIEDKSMNMLDCLQKSIDLVHKNHIEDTTEMEDRYFRETGEKIKLPQVSVPEGFLESVQAGAKLVFKCLLFLSSNADDHYYDWDDRAPRDIVHSANHGEKEGTRKTAERTLSNRDYLKIRFVGRKFAESSTFINPEHSGSKKSKHVRRGHFRNQAYGPEHSLRKVVFIPPMVINPDSGEDLGRIYES